MAGHAGWLDEAVTAFHDECFAKIALGAGDPEADLRTPLATLLRAVGDRLGGPVTLSDEVRDAERGIRPDYGVWVKGAMVGFVEAKRPGAPIDPATFTGHNLRQWERQHDLPNLLYTNGTAWRLYRDGEPVGEPVVLSGAALDQRGALRADERFETMLRDFLAWRPVPIASVASLVRAIAPLTRLLRAEVVDQLARERADAGPSDDPAAHPFTGLATDWRALLFPQAADDTFADGYAQAVTFALLLARTQGIDVGTVRLHEIGDQLSAGHSLMGRALQLLTDHVAATFRPTLDLLGRVVGAVDWERVRAGRADTYLHLYEHFLEVYDPELRQKSGTYYTPSEVVTEMVRLSEQALTTRLDRPRGFLDGSVHVIDPAMGTGTFLTAIVERAAARVADDDGPGFVPGELTKLAARLAGFEMQMGPFAVAELRLAETLAAHGAPSARPGLYVTDTLADPEIETPPLSHDLYPIAQSRLRANAYKREAEVTVVIGNPPYDERAKGRGGWIESGQGGAHSRPKLDDFKEPGNGRLEYVLKNLYVYFWRWATWKAWESTPSLPDGDAGLVCFISTAGYLAGPGFAGMRRYLRRWASEGWVIDLTPEGQRPDVPTRVFPGVQQPLAIGLFVRTPEADEDVAARVRFRSVAGRQADKFVALARIGLDDGGWLAARDDWTAPFTAAGAGEWDDYPALNDLLPWTAPGVKPNRTWVYAPDKEILWKRWRALVLEGEKKRKLELFGKTRDSGLARDKQPLPGRPKRGHVQDEAPASPPEEPVRVGFRAFDRQWIIPDSRVLDQPRPELWAARVPGQIFVAEQHAQSIHDGPGLLTTALIQDMHCFNGRGGRVLPLRHADGVPNVAPFLLDALEDRFHHPVTAEDLLAYVAGVVAHPGFTRRFADDLRTPGIRVPITADAALWQRAVDLGRQVVRAHTFGEAFADDPGVIIASGERPDVLASSGVTAPSASVIFPKDDPRRVIYRAAIIAMPDTMTYDEAGQRLLIGDGVFENVPPAVWDYAVGGRKVLASWFNYRKRVPGGRKSSPLDGIHVEAWPDDWSKDLVEVLSALRRVVDLEPAQADLLGAILDGPLLTRPGLAATGVRWPATPSDRRPRPAPAEDTLL